MLLILISSLTIIGIGTILYFILRKYFPKAQNMSLLLYTSLVTGTLIPYVGTPLSMILAALVLYYQDKPYKIAVIGFLLFLVVTYVLSHSVIILPL
jgi:predicted PurR-regulated permease PerM